MTSFQEFEKLFCDHISVKSLRSVPVVDIQTPQYWSEPEENSFVLKDNWMGPRVCCRSIPGLISQPSWGTSAGPQSCTAQYSPVAATEKKLPNLVQEERRIPLLPSTSTIVQHGQLESPVSKPSLKGKVYGDVCSHCSSTNMLVILSQGLGA